MHPDPDLPPIGSAWPYGNSAYHRLRNKFGYLFGRILMRSINKEIHRFRGKHDLRRHDILNGNASRLATIAQIARQFDFPRRHSPNWFHYVGAMHNSGSRQEIGFPFERLDGRPLIYASMGTAQNRLYSIFRAIAEACVDTPAQLVISMGGGGTPSELGELAGNPIVVAYAPQLDLIRRASLVIPHAGMNTAAESIAQGVPMVAIPVTNDQPAVAARIAWTGCGVAIPFSKASADLVARAVKQVLADNQYAARARELAEANQLAGGAAKAADVIEQLFCKRRSSDRLPLIK